LKSGNQTGTVPEFCVLVSEERFVFRSAFLLQNFAFLVQNFGGHSVQPYRWFLYSNISDTHVTQRILSQADV